MTARGRDTGGAPAALRAPRSSGVAQPPTRSSERQAASHLVAGLQSRLFRLCAVGPCARSRTHRVLEIMEEIAKADASTACACQTRLCTHVFSLLRRKSARIFADPKAVLPWLRSGRPPVTVEGGTRSPQLRGSRAPTTRLARRALHRARRRRQAARDADGKPIARTWYCGAVAPLQPCERAPACAGTASDASA